MGGAVTNIVLVGLALAILSSNFAGAPASAASASITLFGHATRGWGQSNATIQKPGPTISIDQGDTLTVTIFANDTEPHNWFIDYDNDSVVDANEPSSDDINVGGVVSVTLMFTANRPGTFMYRCRYHPANMIGTIDVAAAPVQPAGDSTLLVVGGAIVAVVIVAVAAIMLRRKPKPPTQPPMQPPLQP